MAKVDQRRFDNQHPTELLTSAAAAAFLGVKPRTLYAYVSRGFLTRVRAGQRSRYARAELERLKVRHDARAGHGAVAGGALHFGEPVLSTEISGVDAGGPIYRGVHATKLVDTPFLDVCLHLWGGEAGPPATMLGARRASRPVRGASPVDALLLPLADVLLDGLAQGGAPGGLAPAAERARALGLVRALAGAHAPGARDGDPSQLLLAGFGVAATPWRRALVNAALVLSADHELNASTFAARVAASTGADLQACLLAALGTFLGPKHGAASHALERLLAELPRASPAAARAWVRARTARGEGMPGFGHFLYPAGDPRARVLLALCARGPGRGRLGNLGAVIAATRAVRGEEPNVDAGLVAVARAVGLPEGAGALLFVLGRCAGWIAHVFEQRASSAILRPRARYVGPAPERSAD